MMPEFHMQFSSSLLIPLRFSHFDNYLSVLIGSKSQKDSLMKFQNKLDFKNVC